MRVTAGMHLHGPPQTLRAPSIPRFLRNGWESDTLQQPCSKGAARLALCPVSKVPAINPEVEPQIFRSPPPGLRSVWGPVRSEAVTNSSFSLPVQSRGSFFALRAARGWGVPRTTSLHATRFSCRGEAFSLHPSKTAAKCRMLYAKAHHSTTHCALASPRTVICPSPR